MTGQQPVQRTRQDKIRDWMTLLFAVAVIAGVTGALMAWPARVRGGHGRHDRRGDPHGRLLHRGPIVTGEGR